MTGEEAVAALPSTIRVAGFDFAIRKMPALEAMGKRKWGEFCHIEHYIAIQAHMPTPQKAVDTFLHEALHAIWWAWGIHDDDKEERTVSALGTALMTLHRDNPWLGDWIAAALRP